MTSDTLSSHIASANKLLVSGKIEAAFDVLSQIFDGKNPEVAMLLGYIYGEDNFSGKDEDKSFQHYKLAAEAGFAYAQQGIAAIYRNRGDEDKSLFWLTKASDSGNYDASLLLFYHHRKNQDRKESFKFLRLAAFQGGVGAKQKYAIEMLKGNYGILKIPTGIMTYFWNIPAIFRYAKLEARNSKPSK
jgi:TPR repeat protein